MVQLTSYWKRIDLPTRYLKFKWLSIHGCNTMAQIVGKVGHSWWWWCANLVGDCCFLSDGFQRSCEKQQLNDVWFLTITFLNQNGDEISQFHTRTRTISKGKFDHTAIMDWYTGEINKLAADNDCFFNTTKVFKRDKIGLIAWLSNRPETCLLLREMPLGTFGLRSKWAELLNI